MLAAPKPPSEVARQRELDALRVLDSLPEPYSNGVVAAAAAIAHVPLAAISLIDGERQWFKGSCGLGIAETSRDIAFCAHAVLGRRPLVVADARADGRFHDNPLVVGPPFVRFYAGFPLVVDGEAIGALCVMDDRPRTLDRAQVERLDRLADGTAAWLQARRTALERPQPA